MHIVLSLLGTIVTVLILLNRLAEAGISLGGLNPFLWRRRRKWQQQFTGNPIFQIQSPMDATALLLTAAAKIDGDMTGEQKTMILSAFESDFHLSKREAAGLLISSVYLLGKGDAVSANLVKILEPSLASFTAAQARSATDLLTRLDLLDQQNNPLRAEFINKARELIQTPFNPKSTWH